MLELGHEPALRHRHHRQAVRHRPPQHREPQAPRRRLRRGDDEPGRAPPDQPARPDAGRRHLVARARRDLHHPGPHRRADAASRSSSGARTPRTSTAGRPRPPRTTSSTRRWLEEFGGLLGLRVSDLVGQEGIEATHLIQYTYPTDEELRRRRRHRHLPRLLPAVGRLRQRAVRPGPRVRDVSAAGRGLARQLREPRQRPDRHPRLLQVPEVRVRPRHRPRLHARPARPPVAATTPSSSCSTHDGKFPWTYLGYPLEEVLAEIDMTLDEFHRGLRPLHQQEALRLRPPRRAGQGRRRQPDQGQLRQRRPADERVSASRSSTTACATSTRCAGPSRSAAAQPFVTDEPAELAARRPHHPARRRRLPRRHGATCATAGSTRRSTTQVLERRRAVPRHLPRACSSSPRSGTRAARRRAWAGSTARCARLEPTEHGPSASRTWAGTRSIPVGELAAVRRHRAGRRLLLRAQLPRRVPTTRPTSPPPRPTAAGSCRRSAATTSSACSSTPRRASAAGFALLAQLPRPLTSTC